MKDTIDKLAQISEKVLNTEVKMLLDSLATAIKSEYLMLNGKLQLTTKESIGRKLKLNELYLKLNDHDSLKVKLNQYLSLLEKLAKYRLAAVSEKKMYNDKIKALFEVKLSNTNHKDYSKFNTIVTQFDFLNDNDLHVLDQNRKTYELLLLAGVFGNDRLIAPTISKPTNKPTSTQTGRWNKTK